jgi:hypothetical protein
MPDPLPRLPVLTQAYDAAYAAVAREAASLSPRRQSDAILSAVARFALAQAEAGRTCDDIVEARLIGTLACAAQDPVQLTQMIADLNAAAEDDDFPAARLDPRGRHGWAKAGPHAMPRIITKPPWSESTDDLLGELRRYTDTLRGERLHAQLAANIELATSPFFIVSDPRTRDDPHMMPVTIAAYYLLAFEARIRDLETALEEAGRSQYAER